MANEAWGPLAGLIGTWAGDQGLDVSFHNQEGKIGETPYREETSFHPFGPVDNGRQCLYGLDYRTAAWRAGGDSPFHTEVGYWMWDEAESQLVRCFVFLRASAVIAGGTVSPTDTKFRLEAELGSNTYGILSNRYLDQVARTTRFDVTVSIEGDHYSYDQTTVVEHQRTREVVLHTDKNTLQLVSRDA
jgi:hypothetical protein